MLPVLLLGAAVYICASRRLTERQFLRSAPDLTTRMSRLDEWPRGLALTFKGMPMLRHDKRWTTAVVLSANARAAVLMDLRGFSDERKGCQYEVHCLLDQVPVKALAAPFDLFGPAITKRLDVLECAGLIWRGREGQMRPADSSRMPSPRPPTGSISTVPCERSGSTASIRT